MSRLAAPADPDARLWYRLRTGQQAAFPVWQRLAAALQHVVTDPTPETAARAIQLLDAYSVLFMYIGSCTAERYEATIRTELRAVSPSFSAEWCADYPEVSAALHRLHRIGRTTAVNDVLRAYQINQQVHFAVAQRLVPDGVSLLQQAGRLPGRGASPAEQALCDRFFWVDRVAVCHRTWLAQTVRRLTQIVCDLACYGLRPPDVPPLHPRRHLAEITRIERDAIPIIRDLARTLDTPAGVLSGSRSRS